MKLFQAGARAFKRAKSRWGNSSFMNKEEKSVIFAGLFLLLLMGSLLFIGSNFNTRQAPKPAAGEQKISQSNGNEVKAAQQPAAQPAQTTNTVNPLDAAIKGDIMQVEGGGYHSCIRMRNGSVHCWGQGTYGQLGSGIENKLTPTAAQEVKDAVDIATGTRFTCALVKNGEVYCWGESDKKQTGGPYSQECGQPATECTPIPKKIQELSNVAGITAGEKHACARLKDGTVRCWGNNDNEQIGSGTEGDKMTPTGVEGLGGVKAITAGDNHTCALEGSPGIVKCWGGNKYGQAGGNADSITVPVTVPGISDIVEVTAGGAHTCARHSTGEVSCWGYNTLGQLGIGSTRPLQTSVPTKIKNLNSVVQIAAGQYNTCARKGDRTIVCWGMNRKGELGDGTTINRSAPTPVTGAKDAQYLASGNWHYCFIGISGGISCWGENTGGQLGIGSMNEGSNSSPVAVRDLPAN